MAAPTKLKKRGGTGQKEQEQLNSVSKAEEILRGERFEFDPIHNVEFIAYVPVENRYVPPDYVPSTSSSSVSSICRSPSRIDHDRIKKERKRLMAGLERDKQMIERRLQKMEVRQLVERAAAEKRRAERDIKDEQRRSRKQREEAFKRQRKRTKEQAKRQRQSAAEDGGLSQDITLEHPSLPTPSTSSGASTGPASLRSSTQRQEAEKIPPILARSNTAPVLTQLQGGLEEVGQLSDSNPLEVEEQTKFQTMPKHNRWAQSLSGLQFPTLSRLNTGLFAKVALDEVAKDSRHDKAGNDIEEPLDGLVDTRDKVTPSSFDPGLISDSALPPAKLSQSKSQSGRKLVRRSTTSVQNPRQLYNIHTTLKEPQEDSSGHGLDEQSLFIVQRPNPSPLHQVPGRRPPLQSKGSGNEGHASNLSDHNKFTASEISLKGMPTISGALLAQGSGKKHKSWASPFRSIWRYTIQGPSTHTKEVSDAGWAPKPLNESSIRQIRSILSHDEVEKLDIAQRQTRPTLDSFQNGTRRLSKFDMDSGSGPHTIQNLPFSHSTHDLPSREDREASAGMDGSGHCTTRISATSFKNAPQREASASTQSGYNFTTRSRSSIGGETGMKPPQIGDYSNCHSRRQLPRLSKMLVYCCKCKQAHDPPSEKFATIVKTIPSPRSSSDKDSGKKSQKSGREPSGFKTVHCCWCNHKLSAQCCAIWTTDVTLYHRHEFDHNDRTASSGSSPESLGKQNSKVFIEKETSSRASVKPISRSAPANMTIPSPLQQKL